MFVGRVVCELKLSSWRSLLKLFAERLNVNVALKITLREGPNTSYIGRPLHADLSSQEPNKALRQQL